MRYFNQVLHEPENNSFESYYLPWCDGSYSSDGPFGESLQYTQEGLHNETNSASEEAGDGFLSGSWYSGYRLPDQVYGTEELSNNGGSNWIDEYKSYFASCWEEDMVPRGFGSREYEDYKRSLEKAETNEVGDQEGSYSSFTVRVEGADSVNPWPGYHFELADGIKDNYSIPGKPNQTPENNNEDRWDYAGLWESVFGYWPCLHRLDDGHPPDLLFT